MCLFHLAAEQEGPHPSSIGTHTRARLVCAFARSGRHAG